MNIYEVTIITSKQVEKTCKHRKKVLKDTKITLELFYKSKNGWNNHVHSLYTFVDERKFMILNLKS